MDARCLIVDDESPARDELRFLLDRIDGIVVVGEATTAEEAQVLLASLDYDLVLLDIHMPGMGGLDLARALREQSPRPAVVFVTAYADHAVEAFDLEASDYLVKPISEERLQRALQRALEAREPSASEDTAAETSTREASVPARIPVHRGDRVILVEEQRIAFVQAARGYAYLKLADERLLASFTLNDLEDRLSSVFVRTHRSYLVNLRHVREVVPEVGGTLTLVMADRDRSASRCPAARPPTSDAGSACDPRRPGPPRGGPGTCAGIGGASSGVVRQGQVRAGRVGGGVVRGRVRRSGHAGVGPAGASTRADGVARRWCRHGHG